nr:Uncharacterised protein [Klebsiella pneumoniae]
MVPNQRCRPEVEYFNTKLENVKVVKVNPLMHDIKTPPTRSTTIWNRLSCATRRSLDL